MTRILKYLGFGLLAFLVNDCIPYKRPGEDISAKATAAVAGKRFVKVSGARTSGPGLAATAEGSVYQAAQCVAGDRAIGVSAWDAALNEIFTIIIGGIVPVTSGAAITAGAEVQADANGKAITLAAGKSLGVCMNTVAGADVDAEIKLALN
jgi:hypothetical protein